MNSALCTGYNLKCLARAASQRPASTSATTSLTWRGYTLEVTLITPFTPTAIIGKVSGSSPLISVTRSPARRSTSWQ